jgi:hypothetical protein
MDKGPRAELPRSRNCQTALLTAGRLPSVLHSILQNTPQTIHPVGSTHPPPDIACWDLQPGDAAAHISESSYFEPLNSNQPTSALPQYDTAPYHRAGPGGRPYFLMGLPRLVFFELRRGVRLAEAPFRAVRFSKACALLLPILGLWLLFSRSFGSLSRTLVCQPKCAQRSHAVESSLGLGMILRRRYGTLSLCHGFALFALATVCSI